MSLQFQKKRKTNPKWKSNYVTVSCVCFYLNPKDALHGKNKGDSVTIFVHTVSRKYLLWETTITVFLNLKRNSQDF